MKKMAVIDGEGLVMGRLASHVAKRLISGEEIHIVNAEKVLITGSRTDIFAKYGAKRKLRGPRPNRGMLYPKRPDRIVKRSVRGMLPNKKATSRESYKRLKTYIGIPKEFTNMKYERPEKAEPKDPKKYITVQDLSIKLGAAHTGGK